MSTSSWIYLSLAVLLAILGAVYISHLAGRIDRAHLKVESTVSALHANLALRSALSVELAGTQILEPDAAERVRAAARGARHEEVAESGWHAESVLSAAIGAALADSAVVSAVEHANPLLLADLASVCRRVQYSRRFHNDAVRQARDLRARWLARSLRLAGHALMPAYIDFDDSVPEALQAG